MYEKWQSMTIKELKDLMDVWKHEADEHNKKYEQAARDKEDERYLSELNQEVVEMWMAIQDLRKEIAERHAQATKKQAQSSFPPSQKSISRQELNQRLKAAKDHLEERDAHLAIEELDIILSSYPRHAESHYYRGVAFAELEWYQIAIEAFTAALRTQPKMVEGYWERSRASMRLRQYDKVIQDLSQIIRLKPCDAEAYCERGLAYYLLKQHDKALTDLNKAIELAPENENAYYFRAGVHMELWAYDQALRDCRLALKYRPTWKFPMSRIKDIEDRMANG